MPAHAGPPKCLRTHLLPPARTLGQVPCEPAKFVDAIAVPEKELTSTGWGIPASPEPQDSDSEAENPLASPRCRLWMDDMFRIPKNDGTGAW